jgi:spermidine synthase
MIGKTNIATMTDRPGEWPEGDGAMASAPEAGLRSDGDDQSGPELYGFLDHLDDIDRDQRYFERYGYDGDEPHAVEHGGFDAPLVFELGNIRSLLANWAFVQSAMSLDDPDRLLLDYTRRMMGFLLFNPSPGTIEIIGLGGGSLAKYCYRYLPDTSITAVEIDPAVIAVGEQFFIPPEDERFRIICDDGAEFVRRDTGTCDVLLVDGFDGDGQPAQLCSLDFYRDCRSRLNPGGVLVINLCDERWKHGPILSRLRDCFGRVIDLPAKIGMNRVLFAFQAERACLDDTAIQKIARELDEAHPISFSPLAREISERIRALGQDQAGRTDHACPAPQSLSVSLLWSAD